MGSPLYLGLEGGATRTTGVLATASDAVVARRVAGPANVHAVGEQAAREAVRDVVEGLVREAGVGWEAVAGAALCLAGVKQPSDRRLWRRLLDGIDIGCPVHLTHDAAAALAAGSPDGTGIVVICGTGSLVYGRRADGAEHLAGGRGPLLGDEGSGFDIGHQALRAAARAADGRGKETDLGRRICEALGVATVEDLVPRFRLSAKDRVAALAPVVFEAARAGDGVARGIVAGAVAALAAGVEAMVERLWPEGGVRRVVLAGGVVVHEQGFRAALAERVGEAAPGARCGPAAVEGAVGAARLARQWLGERG